MMTATRVIAALAVFSGLAACNTTSSSTPAQSYAGLEAELGSLSSSFPALDVTDASTLPTTGTATYDGVMGFGVLTEEPISLLGDMTMSVDFANNSDPISGEVTNLVTSDEEHYDGTLGISNGSIDRGAVPNIDPTYVADLDGTLTAPDNTDWNVAGSLEGDFFGGGTQWNSGLVGGFFCSDANTCSELSGGYITEQR